METGINAIESWGTAASECGENAESDRSRGRGEALTILSPGRIDRVLNA